MARKHVYTVAKHGLNCGAEGFVIAKFDKSLAAPDERGGNRHARPNATAPRLDSTDSCRWGVKVDSGRTGVVPKNVEKGGAALLALSL